MRAIANIVRYLGVDLQNNVATRALSRVFNRDASEMKPRSHDRADLRACGLASLNGIMGALVGDPEAGVQMVAEALAPPETIGARQLAAAQAGVCANIAQSYRG